MRFPFTLARGRLFDCAGFGENTIDHLIAAPHALAPDSKIEVAGYRQAAGGQIASALVGLRRLGARVTYAGRFGDGAEGRFGIDSLRAEDVDTRFCEIVPEARTHVSFVIVDAETGERTILYQRDPLLAYKVEDAPAQLPQIARVLHADAHDPEATLGLMIAARESGTIVSADFDRVDAGVIAMLPFVDLLITSREFPLLLTGIADERDALAEVKRRAGCQVAGVTRGAGGSLVLVGEDFVEAPALPVPGGARDTTGAGDAFHAGFIYGLLRGEDVETTLRLAAAVAALKCREPGARRGLPTGRELRDYLRSLG